MTSPVDISDTSRPRPVRIFAFATSVAGALLGVLSIAFRMDPALVGSLSVARRIQAVCSELGRIRS